MSANYIRCAGLDSHGLPRTRTFHFDDSDATESIVARDRAKDFLAELAPTGRRVTLWTRCSRWGLGGIPAAGWDATERPAAGL
jgi:hypothetical protein